MDAETTTQKLISVFLEGDLERFQQNIIATETVIRDNHKEIVDYLKNYVDNDTILMLEERLNLKGE